MSKLDEFWESAQVSTFQTIANQFKQTIRFGARVAWQSVKSFSFSKGMTQARSLESKSLESSFRGSVSDDVKNNILQNSEFFIDKKGNPIVYLRNYSEISNSAEKDLNLWAAIHGVTITNIDPSIGVD